MRRNSFFISWLVLIAGLLGSVRGGAVDVNSAEALRNVLGNATVNGNVVTLTDDVYLDRNSGGLSITGGTMVLDLNTYTLTYDRSSINASKGDDIAINVNGSSANITVKNGNIVTKSAKGTNSSGKFGDGGDGSNAFAIVLNDGLVAIIDVVMTVSPGAGGSGGSWVGSSGSAGGAWVIDANGSHTLENMLPAGTYFSKPTGVNYKEEGGGINQTAATVSLTQYNVIYNTNGGTTTIQGTPSYTIETSNFVLPTVAKNDYTFVDWTYNGNSVNPTALPTTADRVASKDMTFVATWTPISYKVVYDVAGGTAIQDGSYDIETGISSLPTPQREGYVFDGWYRGNQKVTSIPAGTGDVTLKAHWTEISYTLSFKTNNGTSLADISYTKTQPETLPSGLTKEGYMFGGWFLDENFTGSKLEAVPFPAGTAGQTNIPVMVYAKWTPTPYTIIFNTNGGSDQDALRYTIETETFKLPTRTTKAGYTLVGWYIDEDLTEPYGEVVKGTHGDFTLYAKWELAQYTIEYELYGYGNNPPDAVTCYNIEKEVKLPTPQRDNFTFVGWHKDDLLKDQALMIIPAGTTGNLKLYAEWTMGNSVQISRPANGTITVKSGSTEVKPGDKVGANISLTITATPASADYKLSKLVVNNIEYTTSPQTVVMPAEGGLTISAVFIDPRPAASAPKVTTDPVNTDYIPSGEPVTFTMEKSGECDSLLYSIDGSTLKLYTGAFQVSTITTATKTVAVQAIARKSGCKDGVTTRNITFRSGKITITFNLPKGITASNPAGGEVVEAVASGGAFEFKLIVDKNYFQTLDSIKVTANGTVITPDIYGIYTLSNQTSDVIVNVSGISGVTHLITLVQSANGMIAFTGDEDAENSRNVNHGDPVSVTAMADENYKFQSWTDGETANPRTFMAESDVTLQARFVKDSAGFSVILPELEGVTVKPLTGYSTEVKPGGKFKFYLRLEADYNESVPVVYANNEKLNVNQEVYSIYDISENIRISVDGIVRNKVKPVLQEHVSAIDVETGSDVSGLSLFTAAMIVLQADAPEGQVFSKWNDGKADNPRIVTAADASQLFPLFLPKTGQDAVCVKLPVLAGAGMGAVNANAAVVAKGESVQLKLVVLPSYSQSDVKVFANGKELDAALSLRASSETKTLFYTLSDVSEDMMVDVSGLKLNEYVVSLEQQEGGTVKASQVGMLKHGTVITLTATPNKGNMFMKWGDGNTLNPYQYVVTDNCTLKGAFAASNMSVGNENVSIPAVRIYAAGGSLHILSPEISELFVWSLEGKLIKKAGVPAGYSSYLLPAGMYVVKVGNGESVKIVIR
ncbi:InlB B-repeat-containing protein [Parabacteroides johnsonii]|jgi:uncharacterized repeat protein (TIGR02543 family)|uniref:Bacterial repeat domain-containing protein n=1 Tax=Parabacteroides johnsonii TaxID=387661 RepID=A0A9Q5X6Q2_9BACT|nr:InlB B-repeat-containing protein [Parabacteroides johnsonii]OUO03363.1 hypothetical protein B5F96_16240 [Parabacteroides johnsonii]